MAENDTSEAGATAAFQALERRIPSLEDRLPDLGPSFAKIEATLDAMKTSLAPLAKAPGPVGRLAPRSSCET